MKSKVSFNLNIRDSWIKYSLLFIFIIQIAVTVYFNLMCLSSHMGYDSSWAYLKAALVWNEHSLMSNVWQDQTNIFYDSSLLLASLLYGITDNIFVAYGLSNIIVVVGILFVLREILKGCEIKGEYRLVAYNLVICPYLLNGWSISNDLGYYNNLITGPSFYGLRALLFLLIIKCFIDLQNNKVKKMYLIATLFLCVIAGISSGVFMLIVIILPYIVYEIEKVFIKNSFSILKEKESIFSFLCAFFILLGKIISEKIMGLSAIDTGRTWTSITDFWGNLGAVFQGFLKLLGVLPLEKGGSEEIMSLKGIIRIFILFIFFVVIIAIVVNCKKVSKADEKVLGTRMLLVNIILLNIVTFALFNVQYGMPIFEERYLVCSYTAIIIIVTYFLNELDRSKIYSNILLLALIISILCVNISSNSIYAKTTNEEWQMEEIVNTIDEIEGADLVYVWGDDLGIMGRSLRVYDLDRVYKCVMNNGGFHHWGDYLYYEKNEEYSGTTVLITTKTQDYIPDYILEQYELVRELDNIYIYVCSSNPIDFSSGITNPVSIDYPYSPGVIVQNGSYNEGDYINDGKSEGFIMYGPYVWTPTGEFDFTLYYDIVEKGDGLVSFDILLDGQELKSTVTLSNDSNQATLSNVRLEEGHTLEYRVYCEAGVQVRIEKIVITEKNNE